MTLILSGSDGVSDIDGSASTPAIRGTDANTGIFFPAADTIAFAEGGAEAMRISDAGNVGVGTTSPTGYRLNAVAAFASGVGGAYIEAGEFNQPVMVLNHTNGSVSANLFQVQKSGTGVLTLDSSGNVGIGITSPAAPLHISRDSETEIHLNRATTTTGACFVRFTNAGGNSYIGRDSSAGNRGFATGGAAYGLVINNESDHPLCFGTQNLERARITSGGEFLVGTTSNNGKFTVSSACNTVKTGLVVINTDANAGTLIQFINSAGNQAGSITQNGTTSVNYGSGSDYRLKENIQPMTGALEKVSQLNPVTYTWKADGSLGEGFIAHELQEVCPDAVTGEKDAVDADGKPQYQGVDTSFLVATLTAAIQELSAKNDALEARIAALETGE